MDLSIIIVNYNSGGLVLDCLRSIYSGKKSIEFEVLVVDNNSAQSGKENILSAFPQVKWIQMSYNSGFARANNEGIRQSSAEVVLLLNSDTLDLDNGIENCFLKFKESEYSACGVQLLNVDRSPQISGNFAMKGGLNYLLPLPYTGDVLKWIGSTAGVKKPHVDEVEEIIDVDWINGAFLMVRKSAIEKAGLLDEDFFLYAEEAEWCGRLKKTGKLCLFGNINIIHLQGETANETFDSSGKGYKYLFDRKGKQIMLSNLVRIRKQFGVGWFLFIFSIYLAEIPIFFIGFLLTGLFSKAYSFTNVRAYTRNVIAIAGYFRKIISGRPWFYKVL